jgi:hypothetical protein
MELETEQDDDLRSTLESAMSVDEPDTQEAPVAEVAPATETAEVTEARENRDKLGRFTAKLQEDGKGNLPDGQVQVPAEQQQVGDMPPIINAAMRPAAREHWASLPEPVKAEIVRRENDMQTAMREHADAKNIAYAFRDAVTPYLPVIQAEGVDPLTAVTNLMQVATTLRMGTEREKAGMIAKMVETYGVDIYALDAAIAGIAPQEQAQPQGLDPNMIQRAVQQQLAPFMERAQQYEQQKQQAMVQEVGQELSNFAQQHEFYGDVRKQMADMIDVANMHGREMSLEEAYNACCQLHPEISQIIMARRTQASAANLTQAAQRSRSAAVSVRGSAPVGNPDRAEPSSVRDAIEAAIESSSRV